MPEYSPSSLIAALLSGGKARLSPAFAFGLLLLAIVPPGLATAQEKKAPVDRIRAEDRDYWFFKPLTDPRVPAVKDAGGWARNEIDQFILGKLEPKGIAPAPAADARTLIRRAYFDLTGLPPSHEEIQAFSKAYAANPDGAVADLIDDLLESPQYGERWGRIWLDLVRYGESNGYKADEYRPHMWRYRDWVIRSLNADMPYDQFVRWQLAGDEIAPDNPEALTATGYLRLWPYESNQRNAPSQWNIILEDITDITGSVLMGVSIGCAKCHDHKFDPIPRDDYFRMQAFFTGVYPHDTMATTPAERAAYDAQQAKWETATAEIRAEMDRMLEKPRQSAAAGQVKQFSPELQALYHKPEAERTPLDLQIRMLIQRQVDISEAKADSKLKDETKKRYTELQEKLKSFDNLKPKPVNEIYAIRDIRPDIPPARILDEPERQFRPGFLTILDPGDASLPKPAERPKDSSGARTTFANWVTRADNPLSTRVIANRLWHYHFGIGIVESANDFGKQGYLPTHPELLDWLARRLPAEGWSLKAMHRLIMNSSTWRQASVTEPGAAAEENDPDNHLLWRQRVRRLEAEQLRDATLASSRELDPKMGGEGVTGEDTKRRAIYQRLMKNPRTLFLNTFDGPDGFNSCSRRDVTTIAPQALMMLNNGFLTQRARQIASLAAAEKDDAGAIDKAFALTLGRQPTGEEESQARDFLAIIREEIAKPATPPAAAPKPEPKVKTTAFKGFPETSFTGGQAVNIQPDSLYEKIEIRDLPRPEGDTFTVEAVLNLDSLYPDASVRTIASRWNNSGDLSVDSYGWSLGITSEKSKYQPANLIVQITGQDTAGNPRYEVVASDLRIPKQTPYYVAAVVEVGAGKDGGTVTFHARNLADPKATTQTVVVPHSFTGPVSLPERRLFLGGRDAPHHLFDGAIARFRLSNRALETKELLIGEQPATDALVDANFTQPALTEKLVRAEPEAGAKVASKPADPRLNSLLDLSLALLNSNEFLYID